MYSSGRYFTVTGDHLEGTPDTINDATMAVKSLLLLIGAKDAPTPPSAPGARAPAAPSRRPPPTCPRPWRVKSNHAAKLPAPVYFKRGEGGILEPVELRSEWREALLDAVMQIILSNGAHLTRREITRGHQGKFLRNALMDQFASVPRQTLEAAIDEGLRSGVLESVDVCPEGGGKRSEIVALEVPF